MAEAGDGGWVATGSSTAGMGWQSIGDGPKAAVTWSPSQVCPRGSAVNPTVAAAPETSTLCSFSFRGNSASYSY